MTHNHSTISIHNHSTLLGLGLENDGKQMISNCLQGKLDRLWMIRGGSTLGLGRIVSGDAGRIDSGADRPVSVEYIVSFAVPAVFMGVWVSLASLLKYIARLRFTHSRLPARSLISKYKSFEFPFLKALGGEEVKMRWMLCFRKFFASASCRCKTR